jgi:hypothetical protein
MPKYKVDFPQQEDREFELIDEGKYECNVEQIEERISATNNPYLNWRFKIIPGQKFAGRVLFYMTSLQSQAIWKLEEVVNALGVETKAGINEIDTDAYIGLPCIVEVGHREYKEEMTEDVINVFPSKRKPEKKNVPTVEETKPETPTPKVEPPKEEAKPATEEAKKEPEAEPEAEKEVPF